MMEDKTILGYQSVFEYDLFLPFCLCPNAGITQIEAVGSANGNSIRND
jgi:hypothetical protein